MNTLKTVLVALTLYACGGGGLPGPGAIEARDVSGNYALTYDNKLTIKLDVGGAVREVTQNGYGGVVDFGMVNGMPATVDLTTFCARDDVTCPSEALWSKVAITQPNLKSSNWQLQNLTVIDDRIHVLDAGQRATSLGGLVDHDQNDRFLVGLGANGGSNANCFALGISLAGGRFSRVGERTELVTVYRYQDGRSCDAGLLSDGGVSDSGVVDAGAPRDAGVLSDGGVVDAGAPLICAPVQVQKLTIPAGAAVNGITEGKVFMGYTGGCAFGPFLAGATLTLETGFTGTRTGAFDPPPFIPAVVTLPDGGSLDGGLVLDGGR